MPNQPLTETESNDLEDLLYAAMDAGMEAMTLEMIDGFFCALICGPEAVLPSEYMPEIFGVDSMDEIVSGGFEEAKKLIGLLNRHWNAIAQTLLRNELYPVLMREDEHGNVTGREWAWGFHLGIAMRQKQWERLFRDERYGDILVPIAVLAEDEEGELKLNDRSASREERAMMLDVLPGCVLITYNYFRGRLPPDKLNREKTTRRSKGKKI